MPPEVRLVRRAKFLGVAPWDLDEAPVYWGEIAEEMEAGENWAKGEAAAHEAAKRR